MNERVGAGRPQDHRTRAPPRWTRPSTPLCVATVSDVVVKTIDEKVNEGRESTKEMQSKAAQKISRRPSPPPAECAACSPIWGMRPKATKRTRRPRNETLPEASAGIDTDR
ncbi:MAG: hypothetical protein ACLTDR_06290 [Adlercreutzia equolifaciens]